MSELIFCRTPEVLTDAKRVGLGLLCKLLRREWPPATSYESLQHAGIDNKKGSSVFIWLLTNRLILIYLVVILEEILTKCAFFIAFRVQLKREEEVSLSFLN